MSTKHECDRCHDQFNSKTSVHEITIEAEVWTIELCKSCLTDFKKWL